VQRQIGRDHRVVERLPGSGPMGAIDPMRLPAGDTLRDIFFVALDGDF